MTPKRNPSDSKPSPAGAPNLRAGEAAFSAGDAYVVVFILLACVAISVMCVFNVVAQLWR